MSSSALRVLAGSGAKDDPVYVDDLFSTHIDYSESWGPHTVTTGLDMSGEGGMVWTKPRASGNHYLYDTERGATKALSVDQTAAEATVSLGLQSFTSTGFTFNLSHASGPTNSNVWWSWRKQEKFFDIVTYTGNGTAGRTISHNLGSVPGFMIVKKLNSTSDFTTYHRSMGATKYCPLNDRDAFNTGTGIWNNTAPTATEFTVGDNTRVNNNGDTFVAYLFAHDEQDFGENSDEAIIKCGSYTGNGNNTGPVIDLGFEPQWVMIKDASASARDWWMFDTMRNWNVVNASELKANSSAAEAATIGAYNWLEPLSNGFQITDAATGLNTNGNTHIYIAIARPHKPASEFAATDLFSVKEDQPASGGVWEHTHLTDMSFYKWQNGSQSWGVQDRLRGPKDLSFDSNSAENALVGGNAWDVMTGYLNSNPGAGAYTSWAFRRARGFFDVVTYTGDNTTNQQVPHNLGVAPELMILKLRNSASGWPVYTSATSAAGFLLMNSTAAYQTGSYWGTSGGTAPTATNVTVDGSGNNSGINYVLYLFASVNGISKVGSYTGTASDINIDCGFSNGARFVFIKRTDDAESWSVFDSERGIVAGNDPVLFLDTTAAQHTSTDYIDPLSSGFTVTAGAGNGMNANGGTYIFLAIA